MSEFVKIVTKDTAIKRFYHFKTPYIANKLANSMRIDITFSDFDKEFTEEMRVEIEDIAEQTIFALQQAAAAFHVSIATILIK